MIRWLRYRWYARLRRIDLEILWPSCKAQAEDLDHAKAAFAAHAFEDEAWRVLRDGEIIDAINGLK